MKYRKPLLDEEVVQTIKETDAGIEERYETEVESMVWTRAIDTSCVAHPKLSLGRIVQIIKSIIARKIFSQKALSQKVHLCL